MFIRRSRQSVSVETVCESMRVELATVHFISSVSDSLDHKAPIQNCISGCIGFGGEA